jgi:hypothetical protein
MKRNNRPPLERRLFLTAREFGMVPLWLSQMEQHYTQKELVDFFARNPDLGSLSYPGQVDATAPGPAPWDDPESGVDLRQDFQEGKEGRDESRN